MTAAKTERSAAAAAPGGGAADGAAPGALVAQARAELVRYFLRVMKNPKAAPERRDRAASRLAAVLGDAAPIAAGRGASAAKARGLKEQRQDDAQSVLEAGSVFTPGAPPRLN